MSTYILLIPLIVFLVVTVILLWFDNQKLKKYIKFLQESETKEKEPVIKRDFVFSVKWEDDIFKKYYPEDYEQCLSENRKSAWHLGIRRESLSHFKVIDMLIETIEILKTKT